MFLTNSEGWSALALWCLDARYLRGMRTAKAMIEVFAPPSENDTASYTAGVIAKLGDADLDLSEDATLRTLCLAIGHAEEAHAAWSDAEIDSGMLLARLHWPAFRTARIGVAVTSAAPVPADKAADDLNAAELQHIQEQHHAV